MLSRENLQKYSEDEEEKEFASHARKGKWKLWKKNKGPSRKKRGLLNIQFYICDEFGHYVRDCPQRKRKEKQHASIVDVNPQKKTKLDDDPQRDCFY
jgi:hypothetical protein